MAHYSYCAPWEIPDPAFLSYTPVATKELPAKLPEGIEPVGYNFALIPHTLTGLQLPKSLQPPAAEAFIPYANLGLDPTIKPTDIFLQSWSEKQGKWIPLETDIREDSLHAHIPAFGLFTLGVPTPEVSEEP